MPASLRDLTLDPKLLSPARRELLSLLAAQAQAMSLPCYLAGGFARDLLLGRPAGDLDVVVEGGAIPFADALVKRHGGKLAAHAKFGTAVWYLPPGLRSAAETLDLITARAETYPRPGALPIVRPSTMEDDLRRRDFSINAMAVRLDGEGFGSLLDPFDGQGDLARGVVRVLHPRSFVDDPTRVFRAARYAIRYGFQMDADTLSLVNREALGVLASLSGERIRHELDLIWKEEDPPRILTRLGRLGVLGRLNLPDWSPAAPRAESNPPFDKVLTGYLLWFSECSLETIDFICKRLSFDAQSAAALRGMIQLKQSLPDLQNAKPSAWTFRLEKFPPVSVHALWLMTKAPALREFLVKWRYVKPRAGGDDLKARGLPPGPAYGQILSRLRAAWLDGEIQTAQEEERLLDALL